MIIKIHPSRLGLIMTDPKNKGEVLSVGAKTELKRLAKEQLFGYETRVTTKYMEKGQFCEQECIDLYNSVYFQSLVKNTERRENEWLTGEIDLIDSEKIIDIKCAWSLDTFPAFSEDIADSLYQWQGRAYMMLWERDLFRVAYCMVDTPEELRKWEQPEIHQVSHLPSAHRVSIFEYQRDLDLEEKIKIKCEAAQTYIQGLFEQFEREHQL
jgi:hypothetical protein